MQSLDFLFDNHTAAASEHSNVRPVALAQHIDHVGEKFGVPALVRTDGNSLDVFLNRCIYDLCHAAVMAQMNYFCTGSLQEPADNIDGSVMAIEQAGGRYKANTVGRVGLSRYSRMIQRRWDGTHSRINDSGEERIILVSVYVNVNWSYNSGHSSGNLVCCRYDP